ncbi:MAG TPA: ABC transporter permease [Nocardioidaceae bacterium]|nr:ABC transporter permease [Nocardioidaceae bacterium]
MTGAFAPAPGAAPMHRQVRRHALMETRLLLRNGEQLVLALVIPLVVLFAGVLAAERFDLVAGDAAARLTPGVIALAVMSTAFTSLAIATGFERRYGVIKWLGSSPLPRSGLLLGKTGALLLVEAAQIAVVAGAALALGWRPSAGLGTLLGVALTVLLGTLAFAALGLLMAGTLRAEATLAAANLVFVLLAIGGGVVVAPREYGEFGAVLRLLPSGALHEGLATALGEGSVGWPALAVLLVWAAIGGLLTARTFRWE